MRTGLRVGPSSQDVVARSARVHLAPSVQTPSRADGVWWPRSTDLEAELPALLDAVHDRTGDVSFVGFHRDGWDQLADRAEISQETIWLVGFTDDEPHSIILIGTSGRRLTLMVVAPDTSEDVALDEVLARTRALPAPGADPAEDNQTWMGELAVRLASMEGQTTEARTRTIEVWVREAAVQFVDATVVAYIPILVEHIVREQITTSASHSPRAFGGAASLR